jgi:uncharacterized protein (DUF2147 family)
MKFQPIRFRLFAIRLSAIGLLAGVAPATADPIGLWRANDGGTTRIARCGAALCGTLVSVVPARDPATGQPVTDRKNRDPSKRGRPLVGVQVLIGMQPSGPAKWSGQLYNPDDGGTYDGHIIEQGPSSVRVEVGTAGVVSCSPVSPWHFHRSVSR